MSPVSDALQYLIGWSRQESPAIDLLEQIQQYGSINQAAKNAGLSYKSAWEKIEQLNNLSPVPLVVRQVGGSGGGGTALTDEGRNLLLQVALLRREFSTFIDYFGEDSAKALATLKMLRRFEMKVSARNVWAGAVVSIEKGAVNSVVTVHLKGGDTIVSVITDNSVQRLGLQPGGDVMVLVKAPSVMLGKDVEPAKISARNVLTGTVARVVPGAVNDEVIIDLPGGSIVTAIVTSASVRRLELTPGSTVSAIIKASSVMLAIY